MAFSNEREDDRRRKSESAADGNGKMISSKKKRVPVPEVGHALRSAYDQAVNEDIPPEMLDLLGKLG